jgi:hypothetical protein
LSGSTSHRSLNQKKFSSVKDHKIDYVHVLFVSLFCLTKLLNMGMTQNFEILLVQMLTSAELCNSVLCPPLLTCEPRGTFLVLAILITSFFFDDSEM